MKNFVLLILIVLISVIFFYLYPGSAEGLSKKESFEIIAQRGVHHGYPRELDENSCTATMIFEPTHNYIENTLESIQAAFDYGATIVEIDVRPTKDHQLVVFHDDDLGCRTDGDGKVWDLSLKELRLLDLGYGYTYDGGKTFPFRGKAVGKIRSLTEILQRFPDKRFLVDNKNLNDPSAAELIVDLWLSMSATQRERLYLRVPDKSFEYIRDRVPKVTRFIEPRENQEKFFDEYIFSFGLRDFNVSHANKGYALPKFKKKHIWGWPYRFLKKVRDVNARLYVFVNSKKELEEISGIPIDGIVTYNIELLGLSSGHQGVVHEYNEL